MLYGAFSRFSLIIISVCSAQPEIFISSLPSLKAFEIPRNFDIFITCNNKIRYDGISHHKSSVKERYGER